MKTKLPNHPRFDCLQIQSPVTLSTPTLNQIVNVIKESKKDELSLSLNGMRISYLLAICCVELSLKNDSTKSL